MTMDPKTAEQVAWAVNNSLGRQAVSDRPGRGLPLIELMGSSVEVLGERLMNIPTDYLYETLSPDESQRLAIKLQEYGSRTRAVGSPTVNTFFRPDVAIAQVLWDIGIRDAWDLERSLRYMAQSRRKSASMHPTPPT